MTLPPGLCAIWDPTWTCKLPTTSYAVTGQAAEIATEILYGLSGRQFGLCEQKVRPCRSDCFEDDSRFTYPRPALIQGQWFNLTCGDCTSGCSCTTVSEVVLPGPVHDIVQVKVDGIVQTSSTYRLDDWRLLVRLNDTWPLCNDLNLEDTEVGTWSVTFHTGVEVPALGQLACAELATEIAKAITCDNSCVLPKPVQSITRQGLTVSLLDPNEIFANGKIGLYFCDLFLQTYNPAKLRRRSRVYDIDNLATRRHVGS
jgi:hypothetical protein